MSSPNSSTPRAQRQPLHNNAPHPPPTPNRHSLAHYTSTVLLLLLLLLLFFLVVADFLLSNSFTRRWSPSQSRRQMKAPSRSIVPLPRRKAWGRPSGGSRRRGAGWRRRRSGSSRPAGPGGSCSGPSTSGWAECVSVFPKAWERERGREGRKKERKKEVSVSPITCICLRICPLDCTWHFIISLSTI